MAAPSHHFLGLDLSTQQLKGLVVTSSLKLQHEAKVDFDADFGAKYGVKKGVLTEPGEGLVFAPVAMFVEAVDLLLRRLKEDGLDFSTVQAVSGAGMQHGTVFWSHEAEDLLRHLDPARSLVEQLSPAAFSSEHSPNWQDAGTQAQCDEFDEVLGSGEALAEITGSKAHHRFSGPQILRFRQRHHEKYLATARISLVSSFLASLFLGKIAPIDIGDVCGMNLRDIKKGSWHKELLALAAGDDGLDGLEERLGHIPEDGGGELGKVSSYFVTKYGFNPDCMVAPFTGDNLATILALPLRASDAMVSLGTSTTFLISTPSYKPHPSYHFMNHPTSAGLYMFMLCYKNGSLARERVRDALNDQSSTASKGSWDSFNETVLSTPPLGQHDDSAPMNLGLFFPQPEIVPNIHAGEWRRTFSLDTQNLSVPDRRDSPENDARAIVESQLLSLRLRSSNLVSSQKSIDTGKELPAQPRRVYLVGGGSVNPAIQRLCGEVLGGAEGVYRLDIGGNACGLGAAYKAVWARERQHGETFEQLIGNRWREEEFVEKVDVGYRSGTFERYGQALKGFKQLEAEVLEEAKSKAPKHDQAAAPYDMGNTLSREREEGVGKG